MRSFSVFLLFVFLLLFLITGFFAGKSVKKMLISDSYIFIKIVILIIHLLIILGFAGLYIFPFKAQHTNNYQLYSYFNAALFIAFIFDIPLAAFLLLHYLFGKRRIFLFMGLILSCGLGLGMIYGTIAGVGNFQVRHLKIVHHEIPDHFDGYKIVHISDLHLGNACNSERLLRKTIGIIDTIQPDLLLFTGDLVNNFSSETNGFINIFRQLTGNQLSFSVLGNHDYGNYTEWESKKDKQKNFDAIISAHHKLGFRLLRNENTIIRCNNDTLFLIGVENWGNPPFPRYADLDAALCGIPRKSFTILMSHDPSHWESQIKGKRDIDLTLSGHTHGLQWGVKFAGIPFSLAYLTAKYWGGLYSDGDRLLNVNTGLGTVGVPWRTDMPAEITIITLKGCEID